MGQRRMYGKRVWWTSAGAVLVVAGVLAGTMLANAAGPALPGRTPAQLLADVQQAKPPSVFSGVISESANLGFPSLPNIAGLSSSTLSASNWISGTHTVDVWYGGPEHLRVAVPVSFGETDLRVNGDDVWLWDSHSQMATRYLLPAGHLPVHHRSPAIDRWAMTPLQAANLLLSAVGPTTSVTVPGTATVAGRSAYQLVIGPRTDQSLIGRIVIDVDSQTYVPLQVQVFARGVGSPAFQVGFTSLSLAAPAASNFTFTPPAGAHVKTVKLPPGALPVQTAPGVVPGSVGGAGTSARLRISHPIKLKDGLQVHASMATAPARAVVPAMPGGVTGSDQRVLGKGWLSVAVFSGVNGLAALTGSGGPRGWVSGGSVASSERASFGTLTVSPTEAGVRAGESGQPPAQLAALLRVLLNAAKPVHGTWGSGKLLETTLLNVLITSNGKVLIGAVRPAVLYADAAKVK